MLKFLRGLFQLEDGTGDSKTATGVVLISIWLIIKVIWPVCEAADAIIFPILGGYTGVAGVDRIQKVINAKK